jgi:hypothetical protein
MDRIDRRTRAQLQQLLATTFNLEELQTLCFDLGIDYDALDSSKSKSALIGSLIDLVERRNLTPQLLDRLRLARPAVDWSALEEPPTRQLLSPYIGPRHFTEEDGQLFFGRETLVAEALRRLSSDSFLALVGPPGSGKTSVVLAGIVPALRQGRLAAAAGWPVYLLRPGERPLANLAVSLAGDAESVIAAATLEEDLASSDRALAIYLRRELQRAASGSVVVRDEARQAYLSRLLQSLSESFSLGDLHSLCFELEVDFEDLPAETRMGKARELIIFMERRRRLDDLVAKCRELRPLKSWEMPPSGEPFELVDSDPGLQAGNRVLLVVDQFEELFTLCRVEHERKAFIDNLVEAAVSGPAVIIITLRTDYVAHCVAYPDLGRLMARQQLIVSRLTDNELRQAIEGPAAAAGWRFEPGLVERIIADAGDSPDALLFIQLTLFQMTHRPAETTGLFTFGDYAAVGGLFGSLGRLAEELFAPLSSEQQAVARTILLRLIDINDWPHTARRATFDELFTAQATPELVQSVLKEMADARLVMIDQGSVELTHSALIEHWPRFQEWLEAERVVLQVLRRLSAASLIWERSGRDRRYLFRGRQLGESQEAAAAQPEMLTARDLAFLEASAAEPESLLRRLGQALPRPDVATRLDRAREWWRDQIEALNRLAAYQASWEAAKPLEKLLLYLSPLDRPFSAEEAANFLNSHAAGVDPGLAQTALYALAQRGLVDDRPSAWQIRDPGLAATLRRTVAEDTLANLVQAVRHENPFYLLAIKFLSGAGFSVEPVGGSPALACQALPELRRYIGNLLPDQVYVYCLLGGALNSPQVEQISGEIRRLDEAAGMALVFTNRRPTDDGWIQIGALRARQEQPLILLPVDRTTLEDGVAAGRERRVLYSELKGRLDVEYNPYETRGPVSSAFAFFGREQLLGKLQRRLDQSQTVGLFGLRKMGKSSMLHALRNRAPFPMALVSMQTVERDGLGAFYDRIFRSWADWLKVHCDLEWPMPAVSPDDSPAVCVTRIYELLDWLEEHGLDARVGLLMDEIENILPHRDGSGPNLERYLELLGAFRGLVDEEPRFHLVIASLNPALTRINAWGPRQNPTFSLFYEEYLPPLNHEDCMQMVSNIGSQIDLRYDQASLEEIARLSGGHPLLVRRLCSVLYQRRNYEPGEITLGEIGPVVNELLIDPKFDYQLEEGFWNDAANEHLWDGPEYAQANQAILLEMAQAGQPLHETTLLNRPDRDLRRRAILGMRDFHIIHEPEPGYYAIRCLLFCEWLRRRKLHLEQ